MDEKRLKYSQKAIAFFICALVFGLLYNFAAWRTSTLPFVSSFVFDFEKNIPFLPLSIIPYMTSGMFFCLVFFWCTSFQQLKTLTKRMLFVTIIAGIFFILLPLKFSFSKPEISNNILKIPFQFLSKFDSPFNQSPSLHIAYAFIFWTIIRNFASKWKYFLGFWLILLGISTLTTYQHHFIDILTGALLAQISFVIFPLDKENFENRNLIVANYYFLFGWILISAAFILVKFYNPWWYFLLWIAFVMLVVGFQYQKNNVYFLKNREGNIPFFKKMFYFPYQFIYWIFLTFFRINKTPIEIAPNLFISSKLSKKDLESFKIDKSILVYDLSAETSETKIIKENSTYFSFPYLDIGGFDVEETEKLVLEISKNYKKLPKEGKILIHCTMGFTRSTIIGILVTKNILSLPLNEAIDKIKLKHKKAVIHPYLHSFMKKINL